jgi:hypothetical protein
MDRIPVESKHLVSVGYEPTSRVLHVEFHNGAVYEYKGVPEHYYRAGAVYEYKGVPEHYYRALSDAKSSGSAFHKYIKPHFHGAQI